MIENLPDQEPRWLRRSDSSQPFVVTICTTGKMIDALAAFGTVVGDFKTGLPEQLAPNVCNMTVDCKPVEAWSLLQSLRAGLPDADVYLQPIKEFGKRLLICDMDMTIVAAETLDEVAELLGKGKRVAAITARAMHGELNFNAALCARIALLAGQSEQVFHDVAQQVKLNPGAEKLLAAAKAAGVHTILISGGFAQVAEPVARQLGFDEFHCNHLELQAGKLTGRVLGPIVNADFKCQILQKRARALGMKLGSCCAIGDGANDLPMIVAAGLGIAYRAKPVLRAATICRIDATDLESVIYFMGLGGAPSVK